MLQTLALLAVVVLVIGALLAAGKKQNERRLAELEAICRQECARIYGERSPVVVVTYRYGFPAFDVTFQSKALRDEFERRGANARFKAAVADLCRYSGTRKYPFDADLAVSFTYPGHGEELLARLQAGKV